jgi:GNAT superfamily N-acetyltransferase
MSTSTRKLVPRDLSRVVAIDGALAGHTRRGFYEKRFAALEADPEALVALAAEKEGRLVGFVFAHVLDGEFGGDVRVGVLDAIGVEDEARGGGVATALLAALEAALRDHGARELRTQAEWSRHPLAAFFAASGFQLAPRLVLERSILERPLDRDWTRPEVPVRSLTEQDVAGIVRLDRKITGRDRGVYYRRKAAEALRDSGVRVSHVAEVDGQLAGFVMARVDLGEFGRTEPTAVLDTIGVDPAFARRGVGRALMEQLLLNVTALRAERLVTEVQWDQFQLLGFLARTGFGLSQRLGFVKPLAQPQLGGGGR